eukprot:TRINITY_DN40335_c0_g1_i1.p1 TRINITY_DN40335_c0_g1~~TRINITY_DN40335_c0_g1_i1.p1  ORF type:complete len:271 (-),score=72.85 TRINITY_DN40335_c0_g1_i1:40-852(-)
MLRSLVGSEMCIRDSPKSTESSELLGENAKALSPEQVRFCENLIRQGQGHLFESWAGLGVEDGRKAAAVEQLMMCDRSYPGGLAQYTENARRLLEQSAAGSNPLDGYAPSIPDGEMLVAHTPEWERAEALGREHIGSCAFGIVAGGLGERLGYNGIKLALPTESCTGRSFLEYYIQTILAYQKISGRELPLMIMTSDDTDGATRALLAENSNFGMAESQVVVLKQDKVPSISDNQGRIAMADEYRIQTKPHGHGDVHSCLLYTSPRPRDS